MVGREKFFRDARAREFAEPESAKTMAQLGDRTDYRAPANEPSGHRRKMTSAQFAAQSVSNLCGGMESGINRIVDHWGSAPPALTSQDRSRKQSSFLLKQKIQLKRIQLLGYSFLGV